VSAWPDTLTPGKPVIFKGFKVPIALD